MLYDYQGNKIALSDGTTGGNTVIQNFNGVKPAPKIMRSIAHRGYNLTAPENTIPAYVLAKQMGFDTAECDVSFTSDGVAVLLHDPTIDRTSDGSGTISDLTYAEVLQYDFGSWKSADYAGTKIPTFKEFIRVCKDVQLHPYIELKDGGGYTAEQIKSIVGIVKENGMRGNVTYLSFNIDYLNYVKEADDAARLAYVVRDINVSIINKTLLLKTGKNDVNLMCQDSGLTDEKVKMCINTDIPLEVWCPNDVSWIENMHPYITGVTSDNLIAEKVLREKHIKEEANNDTNFKSS